MKFRANTSAPTQAVKLTKNYFTSLTAGFKPEGQALLKTSLMDRARIAAAGSAADLQTI
jgi:hypothetical protein